jgi:hypothetical protein
MSKISKALEQWCLNHTDDEIDKKYLTSAEGKSYTLREIATEVNEQTAFGRQLEDRMIQLTIDLLTRGKQKL